MDLLCVRISNFVLNYTFYYLQGEDSAGSIDTMSICKSELLFSPVKESAVPGTINFSVDSLDSDIMLTCQANKDNYTIAFEGSTTMGSEDSEEFHDQGKKLF